MLRRGDAVILQSVDAPRLAAALEGGKASYARYAARWTLLSVVVGAGAPVVEPPAGHRSAESPSPDIA